MVGGTPRFIAEIAYAGKLNLPPSSFSVYDGNVNGGRAAILPARCRPPPDAASVRLLTHFRYLGTLVPDSGEATMIANKKLSIERVQTGVRMEERILKVLKALAEYHDMTLGDLLEGIVLHAFDGKCPFGAESLKRIKDLKKFYGLDLDSRASHRLTESRTSRSPRKDARAK
jgi:hypothetical protein